MNVFYLCGNHMNWFLSNYYNCYRFTLDISHTLEITNLAYLLKLQGKLNTFIRAGWKMIQWFWHCRTKIIFGCPGKYGCWHPKVLSGSQKFLEFYKNESCYIISRGSSITRRDIATKMAHLRKNTLYLCCLQF